jgi:type IV pilus assembly protein PilM
VIIKKIQLPSMAPEELAESIQWEAEQYIPFDINDVKLDYVLLSDGQAPTTWTCCWSRSSATRSTTTCR